MLGSWVNKITAQQEWPHYQNIFQTADGGRELQSNPILGVSVGEEKQSAVQTQRRYERTEIDSDINSISGNIILIQFLKVM